MLTPENLVSISGGLVADPEIVADGKIVKFRIGVDYAGSDRSSDNNSGYFDVTYYMGDTEVDRTAKFVKGQLDSGNLSKSSQIAIVGRLVQERWASDDGRKNSKVVIVAETINYRRGGAKREEDGGAAAPVTGLPGF